MRLRTIVETGPMNFTISSLCVNRETRTDRGKSVYIFLNFNVWKSVRSKHLTLHKTYIIWNVASGVNHKDKM